MVDYDTAPIAVSENSTLEEETPSEMNCPMSLLLRRAECDKISTGNGAWQAWVPHGNLIQFPTHSRDRRDHFLF